ncbi:MAG: hypothetical protein AB1540_11080 [Bdellovibrionota bacterium]
MHSYIKQFRFINLGFCLFALCGSSVFGAQIDLNCSGITLPGEPTPELVTRYNGVTGDRIAAYGQAIIRGDSYSMLVDRTSSNGNATTPAGVMVGYRAFTFTNGNPNEIVPRFAHVEAQKTYVDPENNLFIAGEGRDFGYDIQYNFDGPPGLLLVKLGTSGGVLPSRGGFYGAASISTLLAGTADPEGGRLTTLSVLKIKSSGSTGKVLVLGVARDTENPNQIDRYWVVRFNTNGLVDQGFGQGGIVYIPRIQQSKMPPQDLIANLSVAVPVDITPPDDSSFYALYVAGNSQGSALSHILVRKYQTNGLPLHRSIANLARA